MPIVIISSGEMAKAEISMKINIINRYQLALAAWRKYGSGIMLSCRVSSGLSLWPACGNQLMAASSASSAGISLAPAG